MTLAHAAPEPGAGMGYAADLDALDPEAWSLVALEIRDPEDQAPPKGFEALDAALTKLLEAVDGARTNLRAFEAPTDAADALSLWEDEVGYDVDFTDEVDHLERVVRDLNRTLEDAAERAEEEASQRAA